jgi:hypothetical protein
VKRRRKRVEATLDHHERAGIARIKRYSKQMGAKCSTAQAIRIALLNWWPP